MILVEISALVTIVAGIAIVQSVKVRVEKIGYRQEKQNSSLFHVVFTLPDSINSLAIHNPKLVYATLFKAAWETLFAFGKNKGLQMGMIAILHTWGQNLSLHPHLHCIVPGGGIDKNGDWQNIRVDGKFLFSVKALSKVFRAKYCAILRKKDYSQYQNIRSNLWEKPWVVYAKRPFGNVNSVIEYLGRYTHKILLLIKITRKMALKNK